MICYRCQTELTDKNTIRKGYLVGMNGRHLFVCDKCDVVIKKILRKKWSERTDERQFKCEGKESN